MIQMATFSNTRILVGLLLLLFIGKEVDGQYTVPNKGDKCHTERELLSAIQQTQAKARLSDWGLSSVPSFLRFALDRLHAHWNSEGKGKGDNCHTIRELLSAIQQARAKVRLSDTGLSSVPSFLHFALDRLQAHWNPEGETDETDLVGAKKNISKFESRHQELDEKQKLLEEIDEYQRLVDKTKDLQDKFNDRQEIRNGLKDELGESLSQNFNEKQRTRDELRNEARESATDKDSIGDELRNELLESANDKESILDELRNEPLEKLTQDLNQITDKYKNVKVIRQGP